VCRERERERERERYSRCRLRSHRRRIAILNSQRGLCRKFSKSVHLLDKATIQRTFEYMGHLVPGRPRRKTVRKRARRRRVKSKACRQGD
jgi:hypothetical protein